MASQNVFGVNLLVLGSSFATYLIYKRYEPSSVAATFILLCAIPGALAFHLRAQVDSILKCLLGVYCSYWTALLLFIVGYRLSPVHPLASYPGPVLCKVSKMWLAYVYSKGKGHRYLLELHDQYGDAVRIGPNELSFRHESVTGPILLSKESRKGPYYETRRNGSVIQLDGIRDPSVHAKRRKGWSRGTSFAAVKEYEDHLRFMLRELLSTLEGKQKKPLDLAAWMGYAAFDFMGEMALCKKFGNIKAGSDCTGMIGAIEEGVTMLAWVSHVPWILSSLNLVNSIFGGAWAWKALQIFGAETVRTRLAMGSHQRDLFHHLNDEDGIEPTKLPLEEVASDGILAIIAGSDTASVALSHTFYFLLRNPKCMERLRQEIDAMYPSTVDTMLDFGKQAEMSYLNACINEALRLYPPALSPSQRRVDTGVGGQTIGPFYVPDGTQVSAHLFSMQRDPRCFHPLPNEFWPDRFLAQDTYKLPSGDVITKDKLVHNRNAFAPFSLGPQNCAGKNIAMMEMRAVLCAVLQKFDVVKANDYNLDDWDFNLRDIYITAHGPLMVELRARW